MTIKDYALDIYNYHNIEQVKKAVSEASKLDIDFKIPEFMHEKYKDNHMEES